MLNLAQIMTTGGATEQLAPDPLSTALLTLRIQEILSGGDAAERAKKQAEEAQQRAAEEAKAKSKKEESDKEAQRLIQEQADKQKKQTALAEDLAVEARRTEEIVSSSGSGGTTMAVDPYDLIGDLQALAIATKPEGNIFDNDGFTPSTSTAPEALIQRLQSTIAEQELTETRDAINVTLSINTSGLFSPTAGFVREDITVRPAPGADNTIAIDPNFLVINGAETEAILREDVRTTLPHGVLVDSDGRTIRFDEAPLVLKKGTSFTFSKQPEGFIATAA